MATFTDGKKSWSDVASNRAVAGAIATAYKSDEATLALLVRGLRMGGTQVNTPAIAFIIESILASAADYGSFDLGKKIHRQRLAGILTQEHLAGPPQPQPQQAATDEPLAAPVAAALPGELQQQRNLFRIVRKPKDEIIETLARWNAYFHYKIRQYEMVRNVDAAYYQALSSGDRFKNFENLGAMIPMVMNAVRGLDDDALRDRVRVAVNTGDVDRIAAVLVFSAMPERDGDPAYVDDLVADPKSIKPERRDVAQYRDRKRRGNDPTASGRGRTVIGEASGQKGGAPSLLQHAVVESGPGGIRLWPYDEVTRRIYLGMRFGDARFKQEQDEHLLLEAADMVAFAKHATGSLAETIDAWQKTYFA